jgi:hypothetical protein
MAPAGLEARGASEGWAQGALTIAKEEATSKVYDGVIRRLMDTNPVAAEALLQALDGDQLTETTRTDLLGKVKPLADERRAQAALAEHYRKGIPLGDITDALEGAGLTDDVLKRAKDLATQKRRVDDYDDDNVVKDAATSMWTAINNGMSMDEARYSTDNWQKLPGTTLAQMEAYSRKRARGEEPGQDWQHWSQVGRIPVKEMAARDIWVTDRDKLDDAHFDALIKYQRAAVEYLAGRPQAWTSLQGPRDAVKDAFEQAGVNPASKRLSDSQRTAIGTVQEKIDSEIAAEEARLDRPLTKQEASVIANRNAFAIKLDKWLWPDPRGVYGALSGPEKDKAYIPMDWLSPTDIEELTTLASENGVEEMDDEDMERFAAAIQAGDHARANSILEEARAAEVRKGNRESRRGR